MGFKQCGNNIVVKSSVGYTGGRHLQNNNGKNTGTKINSRTVGAASCGLVVQEAARAAAISGRFAAGLENLNTARGGQKGLFGFVGEEMQAADASINGKITYVINNNGAADLVYVGKNGHKYYQQVKLGYENSFKQKINFAEYKGQTIVVDKGNPSFAKIKAEGAKHGVKVIEGNITKSEAQELARYMQQETAITGAKKAVFVPKVAAAHKAGLSTAKAGALYGAGFSMGSNLVDVACGDKEIGEAAQDVAKDTAVSYAAGYALGAAGSAVACGSCHDFWCECSRNCCYQYYCRCCSCIRCYGCWRYGCRCRCSCNRSCSRLCCCGRKCRRQCSYCGNCRNCYWWCCSRWRCCDCCRRCCCRSCCGSCCSGSCCRCRFGIRLQCVQKII